MPHLPPKLLLPAAVLALGHLACADYAVGDHDDAVDTGRDAPDGDTAAGVVDTAGRNVDGTWGLGGDLRLVGGAPSLEGSALVLETRGVTCEVAARIEATAPLEALPQGATLGWTLTLAPSPDATCAWLGPTSVRLALGALDPQLRPAADRLDAPWDGSYGLYLGGPRGTVWLVGLAHPDPADTDPAETDAHTDQAADTETALVAGPPADAEYALVTLHGIPLSP
jgi:hypothetical protein